MKYEECEKQLSQVFDILKPLEEENSMLKQENFELLEKNEGDFNSSE